MSPDQQRTGVGLCLSGGGFRAALFHLGALRRLNELNILSQLSSISSVSGGSIFSAHLATRIPWPVTSSIPGWEQLVAKPFRDFCRKNIRTIPILEGALPWHTNSELLEKQYQTHLTNSKIAKLPDKPSFIFCATDLSFGVNWRFSKSQTGDYQAGYLSSTPCGLESELCCSSVFVLSTCFQAPIVRRTSKGVTTSKVSAWPEPR